MKVLPLIIAASLLAFLGATVVWQQTRLTGISYEIGRAEEELRSLQEQNRVYRATISRLTSYEEVRRRVEVWGIELTPPGDGSNRAGKPRA